jgi:hypothetical protein
LLSGRGLCRWFRVNGFRGGFHDGSSGLESLASQRGKAWL